jgi:hypothetical protein
MSTIIHEPAPAEQVKAILLGYLHCRATNLWPGGDGLTLEELLRSYPQAARAGLVPGLPELQRRFPDLAEALASTFAEQTAGPGAARCLR